MDTVFILLFVMVLLSSIIFKFSIITALVVGLVIFIVYSALNGFGAKDILDMILDGVKSAGNIMLTLALISFMTAMWRSSGTLPTVVSYASGLLEPKIMVLMMFLLCSLVSFLTGTAFGTGATMGIICATVAAGMGINPVLTGGAILSGCYFGDRCSPVATSMFLVAKLTDTEPYVNVKNMMKTGLVPFVITCAVFTLLGFTSSTAGEAENMREIFSSEFFIHPVALIPAALILVLCLLRVNVKVVISCSTAAAFVLGAVLQHFDVSELFMSLITGYSSENEVLAVMINGGGLVSMLRCIAIVCISSAYAGIFKKTGILNSLQRVIMRTAEKTNPFTAVFLASVVTSVAACNQTLSIMLSHQLCADLKIDKYTLANYFEDTVVVISPLIPWSIAGSTIIYACGLPISGMAVACYLYIVPLYGLVYHAIRDRKK